MTPAFVPAISVSAGTPFATNNVARTAPARPTFTARPASVKMLSGGYDARVDEFFANDVRKQYIAKACPSGVPSVQCIEGATASEPYDLRTLKRQSQLRYRQLPVSVQVHNMYENRKAAIIACHGCSHEEARVVGNPMLASAMLLGQAEADRACSRYIESAGPAEDMMCRSVENVYMKAVNGSGVFSTACTDGQAKYEAYLSSVRGGSSAFRVKQYSPAAKEGAKYAARKRTVARTHVCSSEDAQYIKFPRMAGSMRPSFGYYQPFVQSFRQPGPGGNVSALNAEYLIATVKSMTTAAADWFAAVSGGVGGY